MESGDPTDLVDVGAGVVVADQDVRGGHGSSDIIDHIAGVAARVLRLRLPANISQCQSQTWHYDGLTVS